MVLGSFTGRFGDPTEKGTARPLRSQKEVLVSARALSRNISRLLMPSRTALMRNSDWFDRMALDDFFRAISHFTVDQFRERDLFEMRRRRNKEVFLHEFLYPALQAYDSVATRADLTIIGSDQLF